MEALPYLGQALDLLLEAVDLPSVFLASFVEKFMPLLPSYVLFPAIGMGASGGADLLLRCLIATIGSVGGAAGWYCVGALIGPWRIRRMVAGYGHWVLLKPQLYDRIAASYRGRPFRITVAGQLVPTIRVFQALPAGVLRLPLLPFLAATAIGAQCWIVPLASAGYLLRRQGWSAPQVGMGLSIALLTIEAAALLIVLATARRRSSTS
jgi:membrane protein DedA with SNARE-associated domain